MRNRILIILLAMLLAPVGMEAKKKVKKEAVVPQLINYPSAELSEYRLHGGNVVVQGRIIVPEEAKEKNGLLEIDPNPHMFDLGENIKSTKEETKEETSEQTEEQTEEQAEGTE